MESKRKETAIIAIVGASGAGKTTLLEKLIPELKKRGVRVGTIKHDVHGFEMDKPGKDSWRHKKAGSSLSMISSPFQIGMVKDVDHDHAPEDLITFFSDMDLILTEGFKRGERKKIEVYRSEIKAEPLCLQDQNLIALVSDANVDHAVPRFSPSNPEALADFITSYLDLSETAS
jgi:molybdopterin-guanine dinucleotide biosynthesis protein B